MRYRTKRPGYLYPPIFTWAKIPHMICVLVAWFATDAASLFSVLGELSRLPYCRNVYLLAFQLLKPYTINSCHDSPLANAVKPKGKHLVK